MKSINVAAAIITREKDGKTEILATERGYGEFKGMWEFPGGKLEPGEDSSEALVREIKEELDADITVKRFFDSVYYEYPTFKLNMDCFLCELNSNIVLLEHEDAKWLEKENLFSVDWLPADEPIVKKLLSEL